MDKIAIMKISDRTIREIVDGIDTPITWNKVLQISEEASKNIKQNFKEYVLKSFFATNIDTKLCFHYIPAGENQQKTIKEVIRRNVFKGPPANSKDIWRGCGFVINVSGGYVWIKDRSKIVTVKTCSEPHNGINDPPREHYSENVRAGDRCSRKKGCTGKIVEQKTYPVKKLIIDRIKDITLEDNTSVDFSKSLYAIKNNKENLHTMVMEKANKFRKNISYKIPQEIPEDKMNKNNKDFKKVKELYLASEKPKIISISSLTEEEKENLENYWMFLDEAFAEALVKDY